MLEQLFDLIKNNSQQTIVENQAVPNEHNEAVMQEAQQSILAGLQGASDQELNQLAELADNGQLDENNPQVNQISQNFMNGVGSKFGLDNNAVKAIAIALIPVVLSKLFSGRKQQGGGLDLGGILGGILGGGVLGNMLGGNQNAPSSVDNTRVAQSEQGGGLMDKISDMGSKLGLDKNKDGKVDLKDLLG